MLADVVTPALHPHGRVAPAAALTAARRPAEGRGGCWDALQGGGDRAPRRGGCQFPEGSLQGWFAFALASAAVTDLRRGAKAFWKMNSSIFYFLFFIFF